MFKKTMKKYVKLSLFLLPALCCVLQCFGEMPKFSAEQKQWLNKHSAITLAVDDSNPPMNFLNPSGSMDGVNIDYVHLLEQKTGLKIQLDGSDWNTALGKALRHEVDGIINADDRKDRRPYLNFTDPVVITPVALLTETSVRGIESLEDIGEKRIAVIRGSVRIPILKRYAPDCRIIEINRLTEGMEMIAKGHADAIFDDLPVIQNLMDTYFLSNVEVSLLFYAENAGFARYGLRNDKPMLLDIFNKAINSISREEHREIREKWLTVAEDAAIQRELSLTDVQREWLKNNPKIEFISDPYYAPIEFLGKDGEFHGVSIDYMNYLGEMLGIRFESIKNLTWNKAIEKLKKGEIDMFSALSKTPERSEYLNFTKPYLSLPVVIYARKDFHFVNALKDIYGDKVAVCKGYAVHEWLAKDHPELSLVTVATPVEAFRLLENGDVSVYVENMAVGGYYLQKGLYSNIKIAGDTPYKNDMRVAVSKNMPELLEMLDAAIDSIPAREKQKINSKWLSVNYEHDFDYRAFWKWGIGAGAVVVLLVFWNRRLSQEVKRRREAEDALRKARDAVEKKIKERTAELKEEKQFADAFSMSLPGIVYAFSEDGRLVRWNDNFRRFLGLAEEDMEGLMVERAVSEIDQDLLQEAFQGVLVKGYNDVELRLQAGDGSEVPHHCTGIKAHLNNRDYVIGVGIDISKEVENREKVLNYQEHLEELVDARTTELKLAKEAAESSNRAKSVFIANMSHELRTPMNAVLGYAQLLQKEKDLNEKQRRNVDIILKSGDHLLALINQVLELAKIESEKIDLENHPFYLRNMLETVSGMMEQPAQHKSLQLKVDIADSVPAMINGDETRLKQVLVNLLGNAVKFTQQGTISLKAESRGIPGGLNLLLTVEDTGRGIPEEDINRIFQPFEQAGNKAETEGAGLGLAISGEYIKLMGGTIHVESNLGDGTRFSIELPVEKVTTVVDSLPKSEQILTKNEKNESTETFRILIADDQDVNRMLVGEMLDFPALNLRFAENGQEAVDIYKEWMPHLIWMDRRMPVMDGEAATAEIRRLEKEHPEKKRTTIVALTASALQGERQELVSIGCDDVVAKPFRQHQLLDKIRQFLGYSPNL